MALGAGLTGDAPEAAAGPSRRLVFLIAALVTGAGVVGALYLGAWAFDVRRYGTHERRLARLLAHAPTLPQVDQAFKDEGTVPLGAADDEPARRALLLRFAGDKAAVVEARSRGYPRTRAYAAGDMAYFIFFDDRGVMQAYAIVSR